MKQSFSLKWLVIGVVILLVGALLFVSESVGIWVMVSMLALIAFVLICSLLLQIRNAVAKSSQKINSKDFYLKILALVMGFFLVLGMLLYLYVFYTIAHDDTLAEELGHRVEFSNIEYLLRSLICSLDLFMLDVDTNLLDRLDGKVILKGWLAVQAVLSFSCTVMMLVGLVYTRLHAYYKLNYRAKISDDKNHLYLFFGNNEPSWLLIKDIVANDPKAVVILIDEAEMNDEGNPGWDGVMGLLTHKKKIFHIAERNGAYVGIASQKLSDVQPDVAATSTFDAFGYLGLSRIKKLIRGLETTHGSQLHIFFMGDDEEQNICSILTLAKDTTMLSVAQNKDVTHKIYCHARYNGPNRVIQDMALKKHLDIKIIDSSHMAVELLKMNSIYHPVNVVRISDAKPVTVETPLRTLIIGFGEVGRDAFRFLYEFGAFVDSKNPGHRSPFECVIVDRNLKDIQGTFMGAMPAIFKPGSEEMDKGSIRFKSVDYNSEDFYSQVLTDEFARHLNYVVISIGDNDEAIAVAARVFNKVRRMRADISDLRILVRCDDDSKVERIQKIADHYNFGYAAGEDNTPVIHIFGQPEKTYTYDLVVSDRLVREGKCFHEKYRLLSGEGKSWDQRHEMLTQTGVPNIESLRKLRRQESQDRANALHAATKMILLQKAMQTLSGNKTPDWSSFYDRYFNELGVAEAVGKRQQIHYPALTDNENDMIRHLAMLEHIRWNAAHELMGYVFCEDSDGCNERTMTHNCLCSWEMLDLQSDKIIDWDCDYKKYDFCVVDTTIALNRKHLLTEKL